MLTTLSRPVAAIHSTPAVFDLEDSSSFGLQGIRRDALTLLRSECIMPLAVALALHDKTAFSRMDVVEELLRRNHHWVDRFEVVHLIEKSLWIQGHCDLVMTLTRNPSQIPESPPHEVQAMLTRACVAHPQANIWYGVPLFGNETTPDGLPIPLSADEVRAENVRRIAAARDHARRYGRLYRALVRMLQLPQALRRTFATASHLALRPLVRLQQTIRLAKRDARRRRRARAIAELDYIATGRSRTVIPEHSTLLGRTAFQGLEVVARQLDSRGTIDNLAFAGLSAFPLMPLLFVPMTIISADPFLFLELPDERGRLRHIAHWYWQGTERGRQRLHVHV